MAKETVENVKVAVTQTGADQVAASLDKVADKQEAIDKGDAEAKVTTTGVPATLDDLGKVAREAQTVDESDPEVRIRDAGLGDVLDDLRSIQTDAGKTKAKLDAMGDGAPAAAEKVHGSTDEMSQAVGAFDSDLGNLVGSVGDVGSAAKTMGGQLAGAFGLGEEAAAGLATSLGVGGAVVAAVILFWQTFVAGGDKAKAKIEEVIGAMSSGDLAKASADVVDLLQPWKSVMDDVGVSTQDATRFITGQSDAIAALAGVNTSGTGSAALLARQMEILRDKYADANGAVAAQQVAQLQAAQAMGATSSQLLDLATNALPSVQKQILAYVAQLNGIPPSKLTEIETDADPDDVKQVQALLDNLAKDRTQTTTADAKTGTAESDLNHTARDRTATINVKVNAATVLTGGLGNLPGLQGLPRAAAPAGLGAGPDTPGTAPLDYGPAAAPGVTAPAVQPIVVNRTYHISVHVPVGTPTAAVGRYVTDAVDLFERSNGGRRGPRS